MEQPELVQLAESAMDIAARRGYAIVEWSKCPHCAFSNNVHPHFHAETLECVNCKKRFGSKAFTPPVSGELRMEHLQAAMEVVQMSKKKEAEQFRLPPLSEQEMAKLPQWVQVVLARHAIQVAKHTVEKAYAIALSLAENEVR